MPPPDTAQRIDVGYWFSANDEHNAHLPKPQNHVDKMWDPVERDLVIAHLENGKVDNSFRGMSLCRFCGMWNGSEDITDGTYVWPSGLAHYLKEHTVRLPAAFVAHVRSFVAPPASEPPATTAKRKRDELRKGLR